jgi:uncharacterized membrane protein YcaP (DUF421 family)
MTTAIRYLTVGLVTAVIYTFLLALLRLFGRRQLAQLTTFDLVVVLLLGSAVETTMIRGYIVLGAGLMSAGSLLVMNAILTRLMLRSRRFRHLVGGGPVLLVNHGVVVEEHLRAASLTRNDLAEALRSQGFDGVGKVRAAVLETDGSLSVIPVDDPQPA